MNSVAELKRFEADSKLQKDKQKVMSALANDPVGLSISQLMTVCRLSIKTVKNILSVIEVEQEDGVYFLKNQSKQVESNEVTTEVFSGHKLLLLLRKNKDGYTAKEIMDIFSIGRGKLDNTILYLRKNNNIELKKENGLSRYVLIEENICTETKSNLSTDKEMQKSMVNSNDKPKVEVQASPDQSNLIAQCKSHIKTVISQKQELKIEKTQLSELMRDLFGMDNVEWFVEGGNLVGVYLSNETVMQ
ncbi:hypothetical protein [Acinetobacter soli]|uniref:hypothetical protein n=1 Tax=Acinetobacter soli TaxID=487316 RepID=UPI00125CE873|nr:hypothetical protein [Acinetobacter soli]